MQDLAVVGMGLIGAAALRHAAASASGVGIGPNEPTDWTTHDGPFASHYDSGRVTRRLDARREWSILASRSIEQYPTIEAESEMAFHRPSGLLFVRGDQVGLDKLSAVAGEFEIPVQRGPVSQVLADHPDLAFPDHLTVVSEPGPAGAIDPRRMIEAQCRVAKRRGALIARDSVLSIRPALSGFELLTAAGRTHQARNVLVAAGAYTNHLLGGSFSVGVRPEVVVLGEVDEAEAQRLSTMPSVIYLLDHPEVDDVYIVPPSLYPDGRYYIKMGGSHRLAAVIDDQASMNQWMRQGRADEYLPLLQDVLSGILPKVVFRSWRTRPCLIADTTTGLPYIDRLDDGITVAFGGNGHAAKSADAIGALAAELALTGQWPDGELAAEDFAARFGDYTPKAGSRHGNQTP